MQTVELDLETESEMAPALDCILLKSAEQMGEIPNNCVALMVTSPPYNVGNDYDADLPLDEYREFLHRMLQETWRVRRPGLHKPCRWRRM